ncbi:MAG: V-type ATP synthase subunit I [Tissierellia bacterium]|nr:V-type ATP synthase subunit I [Tissierellia bacterium]
MAIVKMSEFNLLCFKDDRETLLNKLQSFEDVHFSVHESEEGEELNLTDMSTDLVGISESMNKLKTAIGILDSYSDGKALKKETSVEEVMKESESMKEVYDSLMKLVHKRDELRHEISSLKAEIAEYRPWERFDGRIDSLGDTSYTKRMLGQVHYNGRIELEKAIKNRDDVYLEHLSDTEGYTRYFVMFRNESKDEVLDLLRDLQFSEIRLDGKDSPAGEVEKIKEHISELEKNLNTAERDIKNLLPELESLKLRYEYLANEKVKLEASELFQETGRINFIKGFVPTNKEDDFKNLLEKTLGKSYHLDIKPADMDDPNVPIALKNNKIVEAFDTLTTMYALPRYNEIDPTPFLTPFYWFFFGMMAADLGYGLLLVLGSFVGLNFMKFSKSMQKNLRFFGYLGIATVIWGIIYSSCFGGIVPLPWKPILDSSDSMTVLLISIAFGIVHIFFGLGLKAYMNIRDGKPMDAVYDVLLWYMALVGAIVFIGSIALPTIPPVVANIFKWIMIIGMVGIVLFGARSSNSIGGRLAGGLYELYGISSYVGDFVSYSRLMALGLSGGYIAFAVNTIAAMLWGGGIVGKLGAIVVFVVFHLFNMFLSFLSAYVHSARLTYVEFFGKFYEGGGKAFKKFRHEPEYIEYN